MPDQKFRWRNKEIRQQISVIDGTIAPSIVIKNATYLHPILRKWEKANIWIHQDRIVYVGEQLPTNLEGTEIVDRSDQYVVPGYIEPHAHPFQLYNPRSFAQYASSRGTTVFICDNLVLALLLTKKKAFTLIEEFNKLPISLYWWCRYDAQTEIKEEDQIFSNRNVKSWLEHDAVLQGGELTSWPKVLAGDDLILHWLQETKRLGKPIEGHFPGASEKTLSKMKLIGADCDHEAMTGNDVLMRLRQGYTTSLRYSSIRPDLPTLLKEMHELGIQQYDQFVYTTDGSTPSFYGQGVIDKMISIALEEGVPEIDAYRMATYNPAKHYGKDHLHGFIGPGRIADLNFLEDPSNPLPVSVLSKGKWIKRNGKQVDDAFPEMNWSDYQMDGLHLDWELSLDDFQFSMPLGMNMVNSVIMKPYSINIDISGDELSLEHDESFLMLVDRKGKWRINTTIKGFANKVMGFASSYSNTGDFILIGKRKKDMFVAFQRMKEIGGGMVLVEDEEVIHEIKLPLAGMMSNLELPSLMKKEETLKMLLEKRGYTFDDPVYTLLFLSSTHLPYIRITPEGIYDVLNKMVLFPSIMR